MKSFVPAAVRLNGYQLKWAAALTMLIDHIGEIFMPDIDALRIIGRLSFPLFAWLLVQGASHTKDATAYGVRLLALAIVSQPIYQLTFERSGPNILFTLLLGLIAIRLARQHASIAWLIWIAAGTVAAAFSLSYGVYGVALIALLSVYRPQAWWLSVWLGLHVLAILITPWFGWFQLPALASALLIWRYSGSRGPKARWFYVFYPLHLLLIYAAARWLSL